MTEQMHTPETSPLPFELIEGNEHHGPYIVNAYGATVCDLYAMSNPLSLSVRNGGDSKPIWHTNAAGNGALIVAAVNAHDDMLKALKLHVAYEALPADRGGANGPKGRAWAAYIAARDAALSHQVQS